MALPGGGGTPMPAPGPAPAPTAAPAPAPSPAPAPAPNRDTSIVFQWPEADLTAGPGACKSGLYEGAVRRRLRIAGHLHWHRGSGDRERVVAADRSGQRRVLHHHQRRGRGLCELHHPLPCRPRGVAQLPNPANGGWLPAQRYVRGDPRRPELLRGSGDRRLRWTEQRLRQRNVDGWRAGVGAPAPTPVSVRRQRQLERDLDRTLNDPARSSNLSLVR